MRKDIIMVKQNLPCIHFLKNFRKTFSDVPVDWNCFRSLQLDSFEQSCTFEVNSKHYFSIVRCFLTFVGLGGHLQRHILYFLDVLESFLKKVTHVLSSDMILEIRQHSQSISSLRVSLQNLTSSYFCCFVKSWETQRQTNFFISRTLSIAADLCMFFLHHLVCATFIIN